LEGELLRRRHRGADAPVALHFAFSSAQLFTCAIEKLIGRRNFIDESDLQAS
jgi:hypothetical protein